MNTLGKIFVFFTFGLSLFLLAFAIGIYSNHIVWGKDTETKREQLSMVERLQQKIDQLSLSRERATARYQQDFAAVGQIEQEKKDRRAFYESKFELLKTGKDSKGEPVQNPVQQLQIDKQGNVELKLTGPADLVVQVRGTPLLPSQAAIEKLAALDKQISAETKLISDLQDKLKELTDVMQGGPNAPGLIRQQEIQVDARKRAIDEQENLLPTLANRYSEAVLLLKREAALRKRLEQVDRGTAPVSVDR